MQFNLIYECTPEAPILKIIITNWVLMQIY